MGFPTQPVLGDIIGVMKVGAPKYAGGLVAGNNVQVYVGVQTL